VTLAAVATIGSLGLLVLGTRRWWAVAGSTPAERTAPLPGDDLVPDAPLVSTRAIDIDAAADVAWAWLIQIGQDRGGFYSHTWLENLIGCRMRNADRIVTEWQHRAVGDGVWIHPRAEPLRVTHVDPPRSLVLLGATSAGDGPDAAGRHTRSSWAFVLEPRGSAASRLIVRTRSDWPPSVLHAALWRGIIDPGHFVMERTMMRGLARRAARTEPGRG
jgi:hypothetical protein